MARYHQLTGLVSAVGCTSRRSHSSPVSRASMLVFDSAVWWFPPVRTWILSHPVHLSDRGSAVLQPSRHGGLSDRPHVLVPYSQPFREPSSETTLKTIRVRTENHNRQQGLKVRNKTERSHPRQSILLRDTKWSRGRPRFVCGIKGEVVDQLWADVQHGRPLEGERAAILRCWTGEVDGTRVSGS